jgi:hypothetical protein
MQTMAKSQNKTNPHAGDVMAFIAGVESEQRREDSYRVLALMKEITGEEPRMWGPSMVGFGEYHYKYESGREGDALATGFSPRKTALTLYIMAGFSRYDDLMSRLGKHKTGKSCLYINRLDDVDEGVLRELIRESYEHILARYDSKQ